MNTNTNPLEVMRLTSGKFTHVLYTNKKGETKSYTCRLGVKKHLHGGMKYFIPNSITVFSVTSGNVGYKTFLGDSINRIKCGTVIYDRV
jgi:hypothetical protein